jgi:hypothetical protein
MTSSVPPPVRHVRAAPPQASDRETDQHSENPGTHQPEPDARRNITGLVSLVFQVRAAVREPRKIALRLAVHLHLLF